MTDDRARNRDLENAVLFGLRYGSYYDKPKDDWSKTACEQIGAKNMSDMIDLTVTRNEHLVLQRVAELAGQLERCKLMNQKHIIYTEELTTKHNNLVSDFDLAVNDINEYKKVLSDNDIEIARLQKLVDDYADKLETAKTRKGKQRR